MTILETVLATKLEELNAVNEFVVVEGNLKCTEVCIWCRKATPFACFTVGRFDGVGRERRYQCSNCKSVYHEDYLTLVIRNLVFDLMTNKSSRKDFKDALSILEEP